MATKPPPTWLQRFTRRTMRFSRSRTGLGVLGVGAFMETTVFPLMMEIMAVPMMLAQRKKIWQFVLVIWLGTVLGAIVTYWLSFFLFDSLGNWFITTFDYEKQYASFQQMFDRHGFWAIVIVGFTPIPFHVAIVTAGAAKYSFGWYLIAVAFSRLMRYGILGGVMYFYGYHLRKWSRQERRDEAAKKKAS